MVKLGANDTTVYRMNLADRAIRVPQAAGTSGIRGTVTVTSKMPMGWAPASDLG